VLDNPTNDILLSKLSDIKNASDDNLEELTFSVDEVCERIKIEKELKERIENKIRKEFEKDVRKIFNDKTDEEIMQELEKRNPEINKKTEEEFENRKDSEVYPLQQVKLLLFKNAKYDDIHELIKNVVYKGTKGKFSIKSHGLLIQK